MFTQDLAEAKADRITLQEIDPTALVLLIDFIYTSEIHVTEENVQVFIEKYLIVVYHFFFALCLVSQKETCSRHDI